MLLNSHVSAYTRCLAEKVCGLVRSTWGTSQGEDKLGARDKILSTKVVRRACTRQTFPYGKGYTIIYFVPILFHFCSNLSPLCFADHHTVG